MKTKIEIELDWLESLRKREKELLQQNQELKEKLLQFNDIEIQKTIKTEAFKLFNSYIKKTFELLGFKTKLSTVIYMDEIKLNNIDWVNSDKVKAHIEVHINQWKIAFLNIGVITNNKN